MDEISKMTKMSAEEKRAWAVSRLIQMQAEKGRLPQKSDFDVVTLSRIKAFLGPWPRALEKAGLKEAKPKPAKKRKARQPCKENAAVVQDGKLKEREEL